jgi:hypothetical protein
MRAGHENAVSPHGRCYKPCPSPAEDRTLHTQFHSKPAHAFDILRTSGNPPFHSRHKRAEKANQAYPKANDIRSMKNVSIPLSQKAVDINFFLL